MLQDLHQGSLLPGEASGKNLLVFVDCHVLQSKPSDRWLGSSLGRFTGYFFSFFGVK
ncbi:Hypothetical protein FKW44_004915 [Caligus rogercresseyi]|uniref:Uncharacterized protein n=1 Tax=Caligus rogercresseyi TaxID=217165 RepID=A0A7T8KAT9_CALRO|nr:Hypothetical protein FKW44_004915 [Caligus rogercresseyi]